jgi:hypothetical protein
MKFKHMMQKIFSLKTLKKIAIFFLYLFIFFLVFGFIFNASCSRVRLDFKPVEDISVREQKNIGEGITNYTRPEESTYLTYPEWYLVFNPQEYARYMTVSRPSGFGYFRSIGQFWGGYCSVYGIAKHSYPFDVGDNLMNGVIGTSFTLEYGIKGMYENTVGRFFEWINGGAQTEEDVYAAQVATEYGEFVPTEPWFAFPFGKKFIGLWTQTHLFGPHILRKAERKVFLSFEYGVKTIYAGILGLASNAVYGVADTEIYAVIKTPPTNIYSEYVKKVKDIPGSLVLITLPHYQGFTDTVPTLAASGVEFESVAGNDEILMTIVTPKNWNYTLPEGAVLFTMPLITTDEKRIAVQVPIKSLSLIITILKKDSIGVEHLYDY